MLSYFLISNYTFLSYIDEFDLRLALKYHACATLTLNNVLLLFFYLEGVRDPADVL